MASELPLASLQRWMQAVVVHPGTEDEAVASPEAQAELPLERLSEVILPSKLLTPTERVGIYQGMYLLRMEEALESDYPALQHFLGHRGFFELVRDYVQVHPSRSYSLNRLGDHLPGFVKAARVPRPEFCHDLARLELAITEVFDEREVAPLSAEAIAAVPEEAWPGARFTPIAAFRLASFRYPVSAYRDSVRDENHDHPKPRKQDSWVLVYRKGYTVFRHDLARPAHDLLADLAAGQALGEAIQAALQRGGKRKPTEDQLFRWFREWIAGGVFAQVRY